MSIRSTHLDPLSIVTIALFAAYLGASFLA
jgi:hypothetical protein